MAGIALALHAAMDGAALITDDSHHLHDHGHHLSATKLAMAVLLHRLPMGVVIWWAVTPRFGSKAGWMSLLSMVAATLFGFYGGGQIGLHSEALSL
ncbi:MAG TPA: hypothetical protein DCQ06_04230, partial [Myxococcales bacterium]|nr:hypothetical protein [Myxococcales bacterium]